MGNATKKSLQHSNGFELLIHIGPHKTGSTHIQNTIRRNRSAFEGYCNSFLIGDDELKPIVRQAFLYHRFQSDSEKSLEFRAALTAETCKFCDRYLATSKRTFISHEFLAGKMVGLDNNWSIFPAMGEIAKTILEAVQPVRAHFIVYKRDFLSWKKSAYNQTVKTDRYIGSFEDFSGNIVKGETIEKSIRRVIDAVGEGNVTVLDFDAESHARTGLGSGIFRKLGLSDEEMFNLVMPTHSNKSLNQGSLEFIRCVNETGMDEKSLMILRRLVDRKQGLFRKSLVLK